MVGISMQPGAGAPAVRLALTSVVLSLAMIGQAFGEDAVFDNSVWQLGEWKPSIARTSGGTGHNRTSQGAAPLRAVDPAPQSTGSLGGPIRWGQSEVRLAPVGGGHGAQIKPDGSPVRFGLGLAPHQSEENSALSTFDPNREDEGFASLNNGLTGSIGISESQGNLTQSMTLSAPLTGEANGASDSGATKSGFSTMFGLGMKF